MKRILILFILTLGTPLLRAQDIAGDWQGLLDTGMGNLRLVLHITKASDGMLAATLDSVDQAANGIPVKSVTLKDSKLSLDVAAVQGTYEGTVAPDGKSISGIWSQGKALPLEFKKAAAPVKTEHKVAKSSDIDGTWTGTLDTGTEKLRVEFHIVNTDDGLVATIDSPNQGAKGIPTSSVARSGNSLTIEAKGINGVFKGKIAADLSSIDGTWAQGGGEMPLVLKRSKNQPEMERKSAQPSGIESACMGTTDTGTTCE